MHCFNIYANCCFLLNRCGFPDFVLLLLLPLLPTTSHKECKRVLLLAQQKQHTSTRRQQQQQEQNRNNNNNNDTATVLPAILIVRCNFGTCAKYQGGNPQCPSQEQQVSAVEGAVAMAQYFHEASLYYGVSVILQSETRCWERLAGWFGSGLLPACKEFYRTHGIPMFSSHIMELSSPSEYHTKEELNAIAQRYQEELESIDMKLNVVGLS